MKIVNIREKKRKKEKGTRKDIPCLCVGGYNNMLKVALSKNLFTYLLQYYSKISFYSLHKENLLYTSCRTRKDPESQYDHKQII